MDLRISFLANLEKGRAMVSVEIESGITNLVSIGFYLTSATFARLSSRISFKVYFYLGKILYDAKCNMKYSEL